MEDEKFTVRLSSGHKRILMSIAKQSQQGLSNLCSKILKDHIRKLPDLVSFRKPSQVEYD